MAEHEARVSRFFGTHAGSWLSRYQRRDFDSVSYQDRMNEALRLLSEHAGAMSLERSEPRPATPGSGAAAGSPRRLPELKVLDLGCGAGVQAARLKALGHEVYACDIAPEMARSAADQIGPRAVVAVGEALPFANASFDAVLALGVIGYSTAPDAFLRSLTRVLRPGGLLLISSASERLLLERLSDAVSHWPNRLYRAAKIRLIGPLQAPEHDPGFYRSVYWYRDAREFDRLLAEHGFVRLAGSGVNFGRPHFMGKSILPEAAVIALSQALTCLSRRLSPLQRHARIYVTAVKKRD